MASRFGSQASYVVTLLQPLVPGTLTAVRETTQKGFWDTVEPGDIALVSSDNPVLVDHKVNIDMGQVTYSQECWVRVIATSDGLAIGDARTKAWGLVDSVITLVMRQQETIPNTTVNLFVPGNPVEVACDVGKFEIMVPFKALKQWAQ